MKYIILLLLLTNTAQAYNIQYIKAGDVSPMTGFVIEPAMEKAVRFQDLELDYQKKLNVSLDTINKSYENNQVIMQTRLDNQQKQIVSLTEGNGFFEWHMDFGAGNISNRKLSITVQLSDPEEYEGGELQFMINQNIITAPKEKGTAIIFPSFALHRVTPVTSGVRKSIVGWIGGPPYK